jgi:hypothetical protein
MAEVVGLVIGGLTLASLFNECAACLDYINLGKRFDETFRQLKLRLDVVKDRLSPFEFDDLQSCSKHHLSVNEDASTVRRLLQEIKLGFDDVEKLTKKFGVKTKPDAVGSGTSVRSNVKNFWQHFPSRKTIHGHGSSSREQASLWQKSKWALIGEKQLDRITKNIAEFVTNLEQLRSPTEVKHQQHMASGKVTHPQPLASGKVEGGHTFTNVDAKEGSRMTNGDEIAQDKTATGSGHSYTDVHSSGTARVRNGNSYGGKSVFD